MSLTVDCASGVNLIEGEDDLVLHELEETVSPTDQVATSPTKKSSTTIRGIFSKWRSSSQEASVEKSEDSQKLNVDVNLKHRESSIFGLLPLAALRSATSRESLNAVGGNGGSGPSSQNNTPATSPSFLSKQVFKTKAKNCYAHDNLSKVDCMVIFLLLQSFRFGSLHHKKTRRLSRNRSLDVAPEVTTPPKDTPEDEILAFQRRLQNLPDFLDTSIEPPSPPAIPPASPRPRSRSVPKVTLEAPLPLILPGLSTTPPPSSPTLPIPSSAHLLSPSSPVRGFPAVGIPGFPNPNSTSPIPAPPISPGGLLTPHSPKATSRGISPFEEKLSGGGSGNDKSGGDISRRSSVSPASSACRRHDSIFISDMPLVHRAVLIFVEVMQTNF